jgi:hypothetical protein
MPTGDMWGPGPEGQPPVPRSAREHGNKWIQRRDRTLKWTGGVFLILIVIGIIQGNFGSSPSNSTTSSTPKTTIASAGLPLLMTATCRIGTYSFPSDSGNGATQKLSGERIAVADNWSDPSAVEIKSLVIVIYDGDTEVSSLVAGPQRGGQDPETDLNPYPAYLTFSQTQTWTLRAGWTGAASSCAVVRMLTSPQVPSDQFGSSIT